MPEGFRSRAFCGCFQLPREKKEAGLSLNDRSSGSLHPPRDVGSWPGFPADATARSRRRPDVSQPVRRSGRSEELWSFNRSGVVARPTEHASLLRRPAEYLVDSRHRQNVCATGQSPYDGLMTGSGRCVCRGPCRPWALRRRECTGDRDSGWRNPGGSPRRNRIRSVARSR